MVGKKKKKEVKKSVTMMMEPLQQDRHAMERYAAAGGIFEAVYWLFRVADGCEIRVRGIGKYTPPRHF